MDKNSIVKIARTMFYEEGISNVSMKQLAEKCSVAPSLLSYHFKTKTNIIAEVIVMYSREIDDLISKKFYEQMIPFNVRYASVVDLLVKLEVYEQDPKARAFLIEYLNLGMDSIYSTGYDSIYRELDKYMILNIDRSYDQIPSIATATHAAVLSLMFSYYTGTLNCTYEQFVNFILRTRYKLLNLSEDEIDDIVQNGLKLYRQFVFTIKPEFVVE